MVNYKNGLIYTIRTGDSVYVGSTCNFNRRKQSHKDVVFNEKHKRYNRYLYAKIRENNGEWNMKPHKQFPCENKIQLVIEEERIRVEMNADLNVRCCHGLDKEKEKANKKQYRLNNIENQTKYLKEYAEKNKEEISLRRKEKTICECGCEVRLTGLPRHKRSAKHIKLMETKTENLVL